MLLSLRNVILLLLVFAALASAGPITYAVNVNTSSISGVAGALDFNFNPGPLQTQSASLEILNFASDGTLAGVCPCGMGDVSGQLPTTITVDNGSALNDYFDGFTFGSGISFDLSLYGPALSAPDGISTSGSTFAFSMFSDAAGTVPALTTDLTDGFAFRVNVNLDGTATVTNFSTQIDVEPLTSAAPEPSNYWLVGSALAVLFCWLSVRRQRFGNV